MGHVALLWRGELPVEFWYVNLKERGHLENLGIERRIVSKWVFNKWDADWIELTQDRDRCKWGNELSGSTKCRELLD
jgi:hypothetical protein